MSKTVLFYFTGTGNSLAITRKIAEGLTDVNMRSEGRFFCADSIRQIKIKREVYSDKKQR